MKKYIIIAFLIFLPAISFAGGTAYTDISGTTHYSDGSTSYVDVAGTTHFSDGTTLSTDVAGTTHYSNGATSYTDVAGQTHFSDGTTAYTDVAGTTHYSDGSTSYTDIAGTTHFSGNILLTCPTNYSLDYLSGKCKSKSTPTQNSCNYPSYASCSEDQYSLLQSQKAQATSISQFRGLGYSEAEMQTQISKISAEYDQKLSTCRVGIDTYKTAVTGYNQCIAEKNKAILDSILPPVKVLPITPPKTTTPVTTDESCKKQNGIFSIKSPTKEGYCGCQTGYYFDKNEPKQCIPIDIYYCSLDNKDYSQSLKVCVEKSKVSDVPTFKPSNTNETPEEKAYRLKRAEEIRAIGKSAQKEEVKQVEVSTSTVVDTNPPSEKIVQPAQAPKPSFFKRIGLWFLNLFR